VRRQDLLRRLSIRTPVPSVVIVLLLGNVDGYAVKAGVVVVEGEKPMGDDGRVDVGVYVTEMFSQVRFIFRPIFVFDLD
jgi:hypothetical protein